MTLVEALDAVDSILEDRALGDAGSEVVIEEFMEGEELSVFALCDGSEAVTLLPPRTTSGRRAGYRSKHRWMGLRAVSIASRGS